MSKLACKLACTLFHMLVCKQAFANYLTPISSVVARKLARRLHCLYSVVVVSVGNSEGGAVTISRIKPIWMVTQGGGLQYI